MDTEDLYEPGMTERENAFSSEVAAALRRVEAPTGFADRVMASAAVREVLLQQETVAADRLKQRRGTLLRFTRPVWRIAYATAALLAVTAGALHLQHQRVEQRRTDDAAAQFEQAMQVTGHALDRVSAQLQRTEFGEVQRAFESKGGK